MSTVPVDEYKYNVADFPHTSVANSANTRGVKCNVGVRCHMRACACERVLGWAGGGIFAPVGGGEWTRVFALAAPYEVRTP